MHEDGDKEENEDARMDGWLGYSVSMVDTRAESNPVRGINFTNSVAASRHLSERVTLVAFSAYHVLLLLPFYVGLYLAT